MKFLKNYNLKYLLFVLALTLVAAVVNNLTQSEHSRVEWFEGQEVFEKPEGF